jgi:hypothetical protein
MKHLTKLNLEEILKQCEKKGFYRGTNYPITSTKAALSESFVFRSKGREGFLEANKRDGLFLALSNKQKFIINTIEKVFKGDCVDPTPPEKFEQDEIYRFNAGDPWTFCAKVKGYVKAEKYIYLVLEDSLGNFLFSHFGEGGFHFLETHPNQDDLPQF